MKKFMALGLLLLLFVLFATNTWAVGSLSKLHVEGRNLKDDKGNTVLLHGFAQTYSPWFNERGTVWSNYNVNGCLTYNQGLIDKILTAGWKVNFIRLHMDPYWSNTPGASTTGENDISAFSFERFKTYLNSVFIPMAEYAISKGLYVVMRPPGVCPEDIAVGDAYNQYLIKVWGYVAQQPKLRNNPNIMFELANEPVRILGTDGTYGAGSQGHFDKLNTYFQAVVDTVRANADNILWIPGLGYQSLYQGFAINPIKGDNIGYAVHVYPGWFNSGNGYASFQAGWNNQVKPVADFAPIIVTEMDWAPAKYNASWGKSTTGTAGGDGFGANFNKISDDCGNVSWLIFTSPELIAKYTGIAPANQDTFTFFNDPEACLWPTFRWYQEYAQKNYPRPDYTYKSVSDNNDNTFTNPVIFGDFPDPDVIRVGNVYYMSSTTMFHFPGATILKSYDLVNWEYCSNPLESIESSDSYNLDGGNRYSHGQWASSLRYNKGNYYLHFNTLDEGSYLLTATNPEGPWIKKKLATSFYDAGLFFDEDDKIYIVYGINNLRIAELNTNFEVISDHAITMGTNEDGVDNSATEGSHLYKKDGYYYIYATTGGYYKTQVAFRSTSIYGPYDVKEVFNSGGIHQGALIQTQTGEWWTMLFADKGGIGRLPNLQPVTWVNNWPMVGVNGSAVTTYTKPNVGKTYPITSLPTNDVFRSYTLGKQWEWNHNPDNSKWSLVKNAGYLRLYTANVTDSLPKAKNSITQRILGYKTVDNLSYGTIKLNLSGMHEGDIAGLAVFQDPHAYIGVKIIDGQRKLVHYLSSTNVETIKAAEIQDSVIYLRVRINYSLNRVYFLYSTDNVTYTSFGGSYIWQYKLSVFVGNRFYIFNYATKETGGYVDVDWFSTEKDFTEDTFFDNSFVGYSEESLTLDHIKTDKTSINIITGSSQSFKITALYKDGHSEDATLGATYSNSNPNSITIKNGQLIAKANGTSTITVTYKGGMGEAKSLVLTINATYFPLVANLLNPSIYASGSFNEATKTLITGQWGFGGWSYNAGVNLSGYKYLVAKLKSVTSSGASLRVFDESSYWTSPATVDFNGGLTAVINLTNAYKGTSTTKLNPSHIYIVGFWSNGGSPIELSEVYVTNNNDYSKPTAIEHTNFIEDENDLVNVYSIMGVQIRSKVVRKEAINGLPSGLYLVGSKKIFVRNPQ